MPGMSRAAKEPMLVFAACIINALLFLLVYLMVTRTPQVINAIQGLNLIDFIRVEQAPARVEEQLRKVKPEEPPPPEKAPPVPQPEAKAPAPAQLKMELPAPDIRLPSSTPGVPYVGDYLKSPPPQPQAGGTGPAAVPALATDLVPTVRIEPQYPQRALRAGIEGSVTVEFTIAVDGSVKDIDIIKADPPDVFNNDVLKAVRRWKFAPQTEAGKVVEKRARQDIRFTLRK